MLILGNPLWTTTGASFVPPPTPPVVVTDTAPVGGGVPSRYTRPEGRTKEEIRRERVAYGIEQEAVKVIEQVAKSQVSRKEADEHKRFEELERELTLSGIEWDARYLEALNETSARLIEQVQAEARSQEDVQALATIVMLAIEEYEAAQMALLEEQFAKIEAAQKEMIAQLGEAMTPAPQPEPEPLPDPTQPLVDKLKALTKQMK